MSAAISYLVGVADRQKDVLLRRGDRFRLGSETLVLMDAKGRDFRDGEAFVLTVSKPPVPNVLHDPEKWPRPWALSEDRDP